MPFRWIAALLVSGAALCAQTADTPEIGRAQTAIEQLRALVEAGAAPKAQLDRAEDALADARDIAFLRRTLYGTELTEEQTGEMVAAAERRMARRRKALDQAQKLVNEGVSSQVSLGTFLEELDTARKEYDLAVSRAKLTQELAEMARAEEAAEAAMQKATAPGETRLADKFEGDSALTASEFHSLSLAFELRFARPLPVSAMGETAVHRSMGFDHRNRVDVALHPDQPEGIWLRRYLEQNNIPYFAFRRAVPGKATNAHIHIGPASSRLSTARLGG